MPSASFALQIFLTSFSMVNGCGQLPMGQEVTINFNISGLKLPEAMVFSRDNGAPLKAPTISTSEEAARSFIQRVVKNTVDDVLHQQGRTAGLSDDVISLILGQLDVNVNYEPLECMKVFTDTTGNAMNFVANMINCQIIDGTVMHICMPMQAQCMIPNNLVSVPPKYLSVTGSVKTTNVIMANWSREMWQIVLNRVIRRLNSGSFASSFYAASVTLS